MSTKNTYTGLEEIPFEELPEFAKRLSQLYPADKQNNFPLNSGDSLYQRIYNPATREEIFSQRSRPLPSTTPETIPIPGIQSPNREHLYEFLQGVDVNNRPWTGKPVDIRNRRFYSNEDPELLNFLTFIHKNPNATQEEIQQQLDNCTTQNCATNTFLGLSKMGAKTQGNLSPRAELRNYRNANDKRMDLSEVLGIKDSDENLNTDSSTEIPRGSVLFFQHPTEKMRRPFDHVVFAEKQGTNSEPIYRSLNEGQEGSKLQTLQEVIEQGKYQGYNPIFSGKYRYFFK